MAVCRGIIFIRLWREVIHKISETRPLAIKLLCFLKKLEFLGFFEAFLLVKFII